MKDEETKRVFFALEAHAPWPTELPKGRLLPTEGRHMTVQFLGNVSYGKLQEAMKHFPPPPFKVSLIGLFDKVLFLPSKFPSVVAWHATLLTKKEAFLAYQQNVVDWLKKSGFALNNKRAFLPHVTLCRRPFHFKAWKEQFSPTSVMFGNMHLYESFPELQYVPVWTYTLALPFESKGCEYVVRGESVEELFLHTICALAFDHPEFVGILNEGHPIYSEEALLETLKRVVNGIEISDLNDNQGVLEMNVIYRDANA